MKKSLVPTLRDCVKRDEGLLSSLLVYEGIEERIKSLCSPLDDFIRRTIIGSGGLSPYAEIEKAKLPQEKKGLTKLLKKNFLGTICELDMQIFGSWGREEYLVIFPEVVEAYLLTHPVELESFKIEEVGDEFIDDLSIITGFIRTKKIGYRRYWGNKREIDKVHKELLMKSLTQQANALLDKERLLELKITFLLGSRILDVKGAYLIEGPYLKFWKQEPQEKKRLMVFDYFYQEGGIHKIKLRDIFSSVLKDLRLDQWHPGMSISHICLARYLSGSHSLPGIQMGTGRSGPESIASYLSAASSFIFLVTGGLRLAVAKDKIAAISFNEKALRLIEEREGYLLDPKEAKDKKLSSKEPPRRILDILNLLSDHSLERLSRGINPRSPIFSSSDEKRPLLIEEIKRELLHANNFKMAYRALPKRLRRVVNHLASRGGLEESTKITRFKIERDDLLTLEEKGFVFGLPSPKDPELLILPREYLFMDEMPTADPQSLVAGLKTYQAEDLKRIARFLDLDPNRPKADCAVQIYSHLLKNMRTILDGISPSKRKILDEVIGQGGSIPLSDFVERYKIPKERHYSFYYGIADLLPRKFKYEKTTEVQELLLSAILIPVGDREGYDWRVAIPTEIYSEVAREQIEAEKKKKVELEEGLYYSPKESEIPMQKNLLLLLRQFLLLIESIRPKTTLKGLPRKTDLKRIRAGLGLDEESFNFILYLALENFFIFPEEENFAVTKNGIELMKNPDPLLPYLKEHIFSYSPKTKNLLSKLLLRFKDGFIKTDIFLDYCRLEYRSLHLPYSSLEDLITDANVLIRDLFLAGFLEGHLRKDGFKAFRVNEPGKAFLTGKEISFNFKEEDAKFIIQPNNEIIAPIRMDFAKLIKLAQFTSLKQIDRAAIFSLSRTTLIKGLDLGLSVNEILEFVSKHSKKEIPQPVLYLLEDVRKKEGEIEIIPASGFLKIRDDHVGEGIRSNRSLKDKFGQEASAGIIPILPGIDLEQLEKELKTAGYLPNPLSGKKKGRPKIPSLRKPHKETSPDLPFPNPAYDEEDIEEMLEFAVENGHKVEIDYQAKGSGSIRSRLIEPQQIYMGLVSGYCHLRKADRVFRIDRISQATFF